MNAINPTFALEPQPDLLAPIDRAGSQIFQHLELLAIADSFVHNEIIATADAVRNSGLHAAGDRIRSLLSIARRDLEATAEQLNEAHDELYAQRYAAQTSVGRHLHAKGWLQPHPRLAAMISKWTAALEAYEAATHDAVAAPEHASEALHTLIHTPAPGMRALRSKVAIIARERAMATDDAVVSGEILAAIVDDIDRITSATEAEPWLVQTHAPAEPCACLGDADALDGAAEAA